MKNRISHGNGQAEGDIHVLAIVKGPGPGSTNPANPGREYYMFFFDAEHKDACLQTLARFAMNPELSLTWHDAAKLAKKARATTA